MSSQWKVEDELKLSYISFFILYFSISFILPSQFLRNMPKLLCISVLFTCIKIKGKLYDFIRWNVHLILFLLHFFFVFLQKLFLFHQPTLFFFTEKKKNTPLNGFVFFRKNRGWFFYLIFTIHSVSFSQIYKVQSTQIIKCVMVETRASYTIFIVTLIYHVSYW